MRLAPLLVIVLLAGCSSTTSPPTSTAQEVRFLSALDLGVGGPEPVVAFSPEGDRVYVAAQDPNGGGPFVWVSTDNGASFSQKRPTSEGGGEVDLVAGPGGMVYLTQLGARGNIVSVSRDRGETWSSAPLGGASQYFDREWLAVDSSGNAYVVAREFGQTASAGVARSDDKGITWPPRGKAWTALDEPGEANGPLVAANGAVHLAYVCKGGEGVCVSSSRDGGITWQQHVVADRGTNVANVYPALAATSSGLVAAWSDATSGSLSIYTARSADGAAWTAPQAATTGGTSAMPWLAARGQTVWLTYLHADESMRATDCAEAQNARWIPKAQALSGAGAPSGDPIPLTTEPVHVGIVSPPVGQGCSGSRDRTFGDFFTAAVGPDGKLVMTIAADHGDAGSTHDLVVRER